MRSLVRQHRIVACLAVLFVIGALCPSCSRQRRPGIPPENLLLITFDGLRPDHLSAYGYLRPTGGVARARSTAPEPDEMTFDDLADSGVVFANAFAPAPYPAASLASLFTGRGPLETGVLDGRSELAPDVATLAEVLGRAGFATAGCATKKGVDPSSFPVRGFQSFERCANDEQTIQRAVQWLARDPGNGQPFFLWIHLAGLVPDWRPRPLDPSLGPAIFGGRFTDPAYRGPADGTAAYLGRIAKREIAPTAADVAQTVDLYDTEVVRTMGLVSALVKRCFAYQTSEVEASECWQRTVIVLTSPRGIELFDHAESRSPAGLSDAVLRVPLVLRHPDSLTGERVFQTAVELADVMPTVLDWFDVPVPDGVRGRSLLACTDRAAKRRFDERPVFASIGDQRFSVRTPRWRLIWSPNRTASEAAGLPEVSLFDHAIDRAELNDVAAQHPDVVEELQETIRAWRATQVSPAKRPATATSMPAR